MSGPVLGSAAPAGAREAGFHRAAPVTASLIGPQGEYVAMRNVIAAGSAIAADPTGLVFLRFQRYFVAGLNLGAVK
ncbi:MULTISPECIES: hypothetical protein [Streptomyces]|uniref:Uncharacterized protein n=1 Tax=Streptomyces evansiae TaxID=3075535 RepID=A0ABD5EBH6_9ACTN|nr:MULTISPECIES: hypothetical protein [unclassified Streptomyces]MDT0418406.1 hypothetical protein [Streptomyces sp. DSM 41982]SCD99589.1 hypothetical protein GA0115246_109009 [Streptomyces sp. SolWspMP-sol7th]